MGLSEALRKIFGTSTNATPADDRQLAGGSEGALGSSLQKLPSGERGWITMAQAAALFSREQEQYAFGEMDDDGKTRLAQFAAQYRSTTDFRPTEGRLYSRTVRPRAMRGASRRYRVAARTPERDASFDRSSQSPGLSSTALPM
jgi:hypothetical protein